MEALISLLSDAELDGMMLTRTGTFGFEVRQGAAEALGRMRCPSAVAALKVAVGDENEYVSQAAVRALAGQQNEASQEAGAGNDAWDQRQMSRD